MKKLAKNTIPPSVWIKELHKIHWVDVYFDTYVHGLFNS